MNTTSMGLIVAAFSLSAACAVFEGPVGPEVAMNFSADRVPGDTAVVDGDTIVFRRMAPGQIPEDLPRITTEALQGGIGVNGYFLAPVLGQRLEANVTRSGNVLELQIWTVDVNGPDMPQPYLYEARLIAVPAGMYRLTVVHVGDVMRDHAAGPVTVLDEDVLVR